MVDSGFTDDMHPGGSPGERAFVNYRRFDQPLAVHLAKKGAHTQAVGVGQMELRGCTGAVVLSNVLHVPELDHPLFLVRQALARGWDVTSTFEVVWECRGGGRHTRGMHCADREGPREPVLP
jgi:hypothetical protein